ncbi:MAG: hypothetical protein ACUVT4_10340 [Actinomycetota bacterium]
MEILALLLLGFIAMLAIVPPIIRGKLEDSPLVTTQTFQKSMQGIAHSIDPQLNTSLQSTVRRAGDLSARSESRLPIATEKTETKGGMGTSVRVAARYSPAPGGSHAVASRSPARRAAVRRNRILASLTFLAFCWGLATLFTGNLWCLTVFSISGFLLALYWGLTIVIPYLPERAGVSARKSVEDRRVRKRDIA